MFAYCENDPINRFDDDGLLSLPNWAKVAIGAATTVAAVGLTIASGAALLPVLAGVAISTAIGGAVGYASGGTQGLKDGLANGFMWGGISAFAGSFLNYARIKAATTGTPNSIGKAGERMAGIDPSAKTKIQVNGRTRIPDGLSNTTLTEVKNAKYVSNTQQLRDFATYAKTGGRNLDLVLYVRPTTKVSQTVLNAGWKIKTLW